MLYAKISTTASGDTTVVTGISGKRIVVLGYTVLVSADTTLKWKSGSTDLTGPMPVVASGGISPVMSSGTYMDEFGVLKCADGENLVLNSSATANCGGHLTYRFAAV
jgi:hypothetical protein